MRYSLEPHYRRYVQGQGFMSLLKILEMNLVKKYLIKALTLVNL